MLTAWSPTWVTAPAMTSSICGGVDTGAGDQLFETVREKVDGQHVVQRAAGLALSDRGAYRFHDYRLAACVSGHSCLL